MAQWIGLIVLAFLFGSVPCGLLIARGRGIDIRKHGSGNIGATNVGRVLGRKLGLICFGLDVVKGLLPTLLAGFATGLVRDGLLPGPIEASQAWWWLGVMSAAVLGHIFSPWIGFRGGKGVATGLGAMLGVFPYLTVPALGVFVVWIVIAAAFRYVSLASCIAAVSLPALVAGWGAMAAEGGAGLPRGFWPFLVVTGLLAALVVVKHRGNIRRLIAGTESRIGRARPAA